MSLKFGIKVILIYRDLHPHTSIRRDCSESFFHVKRHIRKRKLSRGGMRTPQLVY
jgi:hypothetical protein